jgi:hypothetical protein
MEPLPRNKALVALGHARQTPVYKHPSFVI